MTHNTGFAKEPLELVVGRMEPTSWDDAGLDEVIFYLKKSKFLSVPEAIPLNNFAALCKKVLGTKRRTTAPKRPKTPPKRRKLHRVF